MLETFVMTLIGSMTALAVFGWVGFIIAKRVFNNVLDFIVNLGENN